MFERDILQLAHYREVEALSKDQIKELLERVKSTPEFRHIEARLANARLHIDEIDTQIRADAAQHYEITGEKNMHPAIGIRTATKLHYEPGSALDWCRENLPQALSINKRFFEKHARAVSSTAPVSCVEITKIAQATIAKDLSEYLGQAETAEPELAA